jgi:hypothetical protein
MLLKLKQWDWRIWFIVAGAAYVIIEAVRSVVSDASTLVVVWLGKGVWWLIRQPMGLGGLALLAYIAILVGVSWWQTRPKPGAKEPVTPELSEAERRIIQDLRTIWNRHGHEAVRQFHDLFKDATYQLRERVYWGVLVNPIADELGKSMDAMTRSVAFDTEMSARQVREHFNAMYAAYLQAIRWLAKLESKGDITLDDTRAERLGWWRESHFYFRDKLEDLNQVPEHHGSLKIYLPFIDDDAFGRFLRAAQTPPLPPTKEKNEPAPHEDPSGLLRTPSTDVESPEAAGLGSDGPTRRNTPTVPEVVVTDERAVTQFAVPADQAGSGGGEED